MVQTLWSGLPEWLPLPAGRLIPAIIQDAASGMVLMLVDLNQEALANIAATGRVHYYHPAKRKVVAKGEASAHFQEVVEVRLSCGGDQLILQVRPAGGACELGYASCFFRRLGPDGWEIADPRVFDPEAVYPEIAFSH
jgi:phosphoribosyl-AMP cyclohydrolase / phosphoribosyl-ATP pyrophosphohydrolase